MGCSIVATFGVFDTDTKSRQDFILSVHSVKTHKRKEYGPNGAVTATVGIRYAASEFDQKFDFADYLDLNGEVYGGQESTLRKASAYHKFIDEIGPEMAQVHKKIVSMIDCILAKQATLN